MNHNLCSITLIFFPPRSLTQLTLRSLNPPPQVLLQGPQSSTSHLSKRNKGNINDAFLQLFVIELYIATYYQYLKICIYEFPYCFKYVQLRITWFDLYDICGVKSTAFTIQVKCTLFVIEIMKLRNNELFFFIAAFAFVRECFHLEVICSFEESQKHGHALAINHCLICFLSYEQNDIYIL